MSLPATGFFHNGQVRVTVRSPALDVSTTSTSISRLEKLLFLAVICFAVGTGIVVARFALYAMEQMIPRFFVFLARLVTEVFR